MRLGLPLLRARSTTRRCYSSPAMAATTPTSAGVGDLTTLGALRERARVLIVGDGNFSFARAFLRHNVPRLADGSLEVTASSLDSRQELADMYPNSAEILDELARGGVRVMHQMDATALEASAALSAGAPPATAFDRVVFNFPHFAAGGNRRNKISRHRQLLREFFASARGVLRDDGQVWVTLCRGQGGTPLDEQRAPRAFGDTWQIVLCAADAGLLLLDAHLCPVDKLEALGYYSVGYQLREKAFWTHDSVTHVFVKEGGGATAQFPMKWARDMSVWVDCDDQNELDEFVKRVLREHFPPPASVELSQVDAYTCGTTGRKAVTYRVEVASRHEALSRERMNARTTHALTAIEQSPLASSRAK